VVAPAREWKFESSPEHKHALRNRSVLLFIRLKLCYTIRTIFNYIMRYIIGILFVLFGAWMVIKTEWLIENLGTSSWAEANLGTSGGSRLLYKLIGLGFIFIGFLLVTNMFQGFLMGTLGKIFIR
jgi:hypothetical protein